MSTPTDTTIKQSQTVGDTPGNWQQTLTFGQFDPALGSLTAIDIGLTANITGGVSIESLEAAPATVTVSEAGSVSVDSPTDVPLVTAAPLAGASVNLGAYDGSTDYAGVSGDVLALSNTATAQSQWLQGSIDLGDFVGSGSVALPVAANTSLHMTGPANLMLASTASAGAVIDLQYNSAGPGSGVPNSGASGDFSFLAWGNSGINFANPVTTAPQTITIADSTTGWHDNIAVDQFNPVLGTLQMINITLTGNITSRVAAENEDATGSAVSVSQAVTLALAFPGAAETTTGSIGTTLSLAGYDGTADFAGVSGTTVASQTQIPMLSGQLTDQADLGALTGLGTFIVPLSATGTSVLDGPGNLLAKLLAQAGATATVSYTYVPPAVPDTEAVWWGVSGGGQWTAAGNWSPYLGVPQAGDDVVITQSGTYAVTLESAQSIHSLVIDAPNATLVLDANLVVAGDFILEAGTIEFNGSTLSAGDITINGGEMVGGTVDLISAGSIAVNGGTVVAQEITGQIGSGSIVLGNAVGPLGQFAIDNANGPGGVTTSIQCFARASRIATPAGDVAVEALAIGDAVLLASGGTAPITWIGHREIDCRRHPEPRNVWPVCIIRGAFGDAGPHRDLLLSPDHAVFVDGVLIPVKHLINGGSIRQIRRDRVAYFHIELPRHDILLAEGLTVESYLDTGSGGNFANGGVPVVLHPDFSSLTWEARGCAPLVVAGPRLEAVRQRLNVAGKAPRPGATGRGRHRAA